MIRTLLLDGTEDRWDARSEALLFAAARADHVQKTIRPALERGQWVICDRFIDSSRAYQGGPGLIADVDVVGLHKFGSRNLMPDRTILLSVPVADIAERLRLRDGIDGGDRISKRSDDYHTEVAMTFLAIAQAEPARVRIVNAHGPVEVVSDRVLDLLKDLLP